MQIPITQTEKLQSGSYRDYRIVSSVLYLSREPGSDRSFQILQHAGETAETATGASFKKHGGAKKTTREIIRLSLQP
jgi:hypothetical protein